MKSGIYKIQNKINNHCYIGSSCNIHKRFIAHKNYLKIKSFERLLPYIENKKTPILDSKGNIFSSMT